MKNTLVSNESQFEVDSNILNNLDPDRVTGFSDAESSFILSIYTSDTSKSGVRVAPEFTIGLHLRDEFVLEKIQAFFGVGNINKKEESVKYQVRKLEDLYNVIIPHFTNFPLRTKKKSWLRVI